MKSGPFAFGVHTRAVRWAIGLTVLLLAARLVAIWPALTGQITNLDEVEMAWSVMDRMLGVPSTTLAWPNSMLQFLSVGPIVVAQVLPEVNHGFGALGKGLALGYRSPWQAILMIRIIVATAMCTASGLWLWVLLRDGSGRRNTVLLTLLGSTVPALWMASITAKGEGLAIALLLVAFVLPHLGLSWGPRAEVLFLGAMAGAVLASRVTLAPALLPLAVYACGTTKRSYLCWFAAAAVGFIALCPSVWLEPLRLAKSLLGNIRRPGNQNAIDGFRTVFECAPVTFWLIGLSSSYVSFARRHDSDSSRREWQTTACVLAVVLFMLLLPTSGRQLSSTYFVSIPCLLWLVMLLQLPHVFKQHTLRSPLSVHWPQTPRVMVGALALATVYQTLLCANVSSIANARYQPLRELRSQLLAEPRAALLPRVFLPYFAEHVPALTLQQLSASAAQENAEGSASTNFLVNSGMPPQIAYGLRHNFDEDEQAFAARLALAASIEPRVPLALTFYDHLPGVSRYGMMNLQQAQTLLEQQRMETLVVLGQPLPNVDPSASIGPGADWGLYLYDAPKL